MLPTKVREFIDTLNRTQQDRVLTGRLVAERLGSDTPGIEGCLIGLAYAGGRNIPEVHRACKQGIGRAFNVYFNQDAVLAGSEIRQYILDKQAAEIPIPQPEMAHAVA